MTSAYEACIIACGSGSRLRPFTLDRPKALVPVGDEPILRHQLRTLQRWGIDHVTILHQDSYDHHLVLQATLDTHPNVHLATAPASWPEEFSVLRRRYAASDAPVMTLNCDLLLDDAWGDVLAEHLASGAALTIAATWKPGNEDGQYGRARLLHLAPDHTILATRPPTRNPPAHHVLAHEIGVSVVSPNAWNYLEPLPHQAEDPWADEFIPTLINSGRHVHLAVRSAPWRDVGTWYRVWLAHRELASQAPGRHHIHPTAQIAATAQLAGWTYLGPGTRIGPRAQIINSALLADAEIAANTSVSDSLLLPHARISHGAHHATVQLPGAEPRAMFPVPRT